MWILSDPEERGNLSISWILVLISVLTRVLHCTLVCHAKPSAIFPAIAYFATDRVHQSGQPLNGWKSSGKRFSTGKAVQNDTRAMSS